MFYGFMIVKVHHIIDKYLNKVNNNNNHNILKKQWKMLILINYNIKYG